MSFIPGPWIESIFISKGVGTVASGYESFTGQINVAHRNADSAEPFYLNLFYGMGGRAEFNHVSNHRVGRRGYTVLMSHGEFRSEKTIEIEMGSWTCRRKKTSWFAMSGALLGIVAGVPTWA